MQRHRLAFYKVAKERDNAPLTSPQRPLWGQRTVAIVESLPLWEGRGVI